MERAIGKAERLLQIEALLLSEPEGLSQAEIARRLGVNRSTVFRCLSDLTSRFAMYETDEGRLAIDRDHYLVNVRLTLHESMALHLAARLMATRSDKQNPHASAALRKLGLALEGLSPRIAEHLKASAAVMDDRAQRYDPVYLEVLETLTRAWSDGRVARVWHRMEDGRVFEYQFAPYFVEPYAVGLTTHAIGWREPPGALRTLKLERIRRIELTDRAYTIPADFDPRTLLADAWGIWYTEAEPVEVVLRFHPRVAARVRETRWHRSEQVEEQPDGSLVWRARVAEPQEMLPWLRGWGADVEVVEPAELRSELAAQARRLGWLYGVSALPHQENPLSEETMDLFQQFLTFPGKTEPKLSIFEHSSDVFQVMQYLLVANEARVLNVDLLRAGALLHDVGKIEQDVQVGKQWNHQPYSAKYLRPLLDHPRTRALLADNGVSLSGVAFEDLLLICEHHHDLPTQPALLRRCPDALLISVADAIASAIESGWLGSIKEMLSGSTYTDLGLSLLHSLELSSGLDSEIHRVDLPGDSVADALLTDLIFHDMCKRLAEPGLQPLLQKGGSLWVVGERETVSSFLRTYLVNPRTLYEGANLADEIFDGVLAAMPAPGSLQPDTIRYLLVNDRIARKVAQGLVDRKPVRQALERFGISVRGVHETFGTRGRAVTDKLEAVGEELKYLVAGAQAAYYYHHWRLPPRGDFELLIEPTEFDTWYAYLRDARIFVGRDWPSREDRSRHGEAVLLTPGLAESTWERRIAVDGLNYISPIDLVFRLLGAQTEASIGEALAILVARQTEWDWEVLAAEIEARRIARQFGSLFEVINYEAGRWLVPQSAVGRLFARVQDTVGEAVFTFPLRAIGETLPSARTPQEYQEIGRRWGLELLLPRHLVGKILEDLGV